MFEIFLTQNQLINSMKIVVPWLRDMNISFDINKFRFLEYIFDNFSLQLTDEFDINSIYSEVDASWQVTPYEVTDNAFLKINEWLNLASVHKADQINFPKKTPFMYTLPSNTSNLYDSYLYYLFNDPFQAQFLTQHSAINTSCNTVTQCQSTGHYLLYDPYFVANIKPKYKGSPTSLDTLKSLIQLANGPIQNICIISEKKYYKKDREWFADYEKNLSLDKWKMVIKSFPNMEVSILELDLRNMDDDYHDRDLFMDLCHIEIGSGFAAMKKNEQTSQVNFKLKKATKIYYKSLIDKEYYKFSREVHDYLVKLIKGSNYVCNFDDLDQIHQDAANNFKDNIYLRDLLYYN